MVTIEITVEQVELFSAHYTGDRAGIFYDGEALNVPDDLEADVRASIAAVETDGGLSVAKGRKVDALTVACKAAIVGGYSSSALGSVHNYPSQNTDEHPDQLNMMGSVTKSLLPNLPEDWATPFWCEDGSGVWAFRMHSAAQIQQAGSDGMMHIVTCQGTLATLTAAVQAAATEAEVDAINWPAGGE